MTSHWDKYNEGKHDFANNDTMTPNNDAPRTFEEAVKPLMKYLSENHNPHTSVIVTSTNAELVGGIKSFITEEFIKD